jgi:N-carbamoyl-L-amino-acid hydrolase
VPSGGWLDGCLGVLAAVELLRGFAAGTSPARTIAVVDWADEEGARFGHSLFGSSAAAGLLDLGAARGLRDANGVSLADAMAAHGFDLRELLAHGERFSTRARTLSCISNKARDSSRPIFRARRSRAASALGDCES